MAQRYNLVGGMIFAGGFTEGFRQTGRFNPLAHFEMMEFGTDTAKRNIPELVFYKDRDRWPTERYRGSTDVVITNPHCSCWSPLGRSMNHGKDSWRTDPNLQYAEGAIQLFRDIQPKVWVWESVTQLATKGSEFLWRFTNEALDTGYAVSHVFYDTKFMGLPQQRRRLFVMAHNIAIPWRQGGQPVVSLGEHLAGIDPDTGWGLRPEHVPVARELKPGDSLRYWWNQTMGDVKPRPRFVDHRVSPDGPMGTVFGYLPPGYIHWNEERYLGPRELARICGFPTDWWWPDDGIRIVLETAKGVTPPAGRWLGAQVAEALDRNEPIRPQVIKANFMAETIKIKDIRQRDEVYHLLEPEAVPAHLAGLIPDEQLQVIEKMDLQEEDKEWVEV
jgi:site-specific DNA-cytosine methylase